MKPFQNSKYKWAAIASLNVIVIAGLCCLKSEIPPGTNPETAVIELRLNELNNHIQSLHQEMQKPQSTFDIKEFNKLSSQIEQLQAKDEPLNNLINQNRKELNHKLDAIHEVIKTLNQKQHPITYLAITALPFQVISIDSIQQISVATVFYDYKTQPLEKSDSLAGWTVLSVNYASQRIEFENRKKERVILTLKGKHHA